MLRLKEILKNVTLAIASVMIFFGLLEFIFRLIYPAWYRKYSKNIQEEESNFYPRDPLLGWVLPANANSVQTGCGRKYVYKTNSFGLRDNEYSLDKPGSAYRVICLGDSVTEGVGVDNNETYPKLLENKLRDSGNPELDFEILNAGVLDYSLEQEYLFLKEKLLAYRPDMVILGYYLNDARGFLASKAIYLKGYRNIINKSKFLYLLDRIIMKYKVKAQYKKWDKNRTETWMPLFDGGAWRGDTAKLHQLVKLADKDWGLAWTDGAWDKTRAYLDKFMALSKENNFKFMIVSFPCAVQLFADSSDDYMFLPQARLRQYCRDNHIGFIDLLPVLLKHREEELFFDHCHYTQGGHRVISQTLFDYLQGGAGG